MSSAGDNQRAVFCVRAVSKLYRMGDVEVRALDAVDLDLYAGELVETAPVGGLFRQPAHPYTIGLLRALPDLDGVHGLAPIAGSLPALRMISVARSPVVPLPGEPNVIATGFARASAMRSFTVFTGTEG